MILKLDHTIQKTAENIRAVFQVSYAIEAKLLNAVDFPPLQRPVEGFLQSQNTFYGYYRKETLNAVIEIKEDHGITHIQSLVVRPDCFRKGIASELLRFVVDMYETKRFTVETGLANEPAKQLYQKFDFKQTKEWNTDYGIRKIAFEMIR